VQDGSAATVQRVCSWQNGVISTGTGKPPGPNKSQSLDSSTVVVIVMYDTRGGDDYARTHIYMYIHIHRMNE
jgi:hypothetical protein